MTIGIYFATLLSLAVVDFVWLYSTGTYYRTALGHLFAPHVSYIPAVIFYLLYTVGLVYFVIAPSLQNNVGVLRVALVGALFGLIAYATYDLTNQATMKNWPVLITLIDLVWGAVLAGGISAFIYWIFNRG